MKKIAFTIVLNGMPFIKQQYEIIPKIFDKWYIVEGVTLPHKDTSWCKSIDHKFYSDSLLSIDGTTEFLDNIVSDKIKIIRKNNFWNGKVEMCNSFMDNIKNAILMQFDVDEIWDINVLKNLLDFCETRNDFDAMRFHCNYFVGPNLITQGDNCYGNYETEWLRLWKITTPTYWIAHEPPTLFGTQKIVSRNSTKKQNWTFNHYAYYLKSQLEFKENFYGYTEALKQWETLQQHYTFPVKLKNFLPWVDDKVEVIKIQN